jgi:hypothetical protein
MGTQLLTYFCQPTGWNRRKPKGIRSVELFARTLASSRVLYICDRFFPSKAKAIGDRVIADVLNGTTYDEDDTKNWSVEISDKIRHEVAGIVEISCCFMP